jgi:hypothetical protein
LYVTTQIANGIIFIRRFEHTVNIIRWHLEPNRIALSIRESGQKPRSRCEDRYKYRSANHDPTFAISLKS